MYGKLLLFLQAGILTMTIHVLPFICAYNKPTVILPF